MRKLVLLLTFAASSLVAQTQYPTDPHMNGLFPDRPTNYLTDMAGVVKNPDAVNARLDQIRKADKLSLVVVTLSTVKDRDFRDVSREIGRRWAVATANDTIGAAVRNTGAVILLVTDIRKCRVEVATGSEQYVTDNTAANMCRDAAPLFRAGDFGNGFIQIANTFADKHREFMAEMAKPKALPTPSTPFPWGTFFTWAGIIALVVGFFGRRWYKKEQARQAELERKRQAAEAQARREAAARRREQERRDEEARQREIARRAALTPEERLAEDLARERAARAAALEAERQRAAAAERRAREAEEEADRRRRSSYYDNSSTTSSWPSSDSGGSSGGWDSGGSSSFGGGGGDSGY